MKKNSLMTLALALFIVIPVFSWAADSEKKIELNRLVPGKYEMVNEIVMDQQQQVSMFVNGEKEAVQNNGIIVIKQTQEQVFVVTVEPPASDGSWNENFELTRIKLAINQQIRSLSESDEQPAVVEMSFDSTDPIDPAQPNPLAASGGLLVGLKLTVTYNSNREPIKIDGLETFLDKITEESPESAPLLQEMKQSMSSEQLAKQWNVSNNGLPPGPVAVGETWKSNTSASMPVIGMTDVQATYTLKSIDNIDGTEIAELESITTTKSEESQTIEQIGLPIKIEQMTMDMTMTTKMEVATGCPVESVGKINMATKMEIELPPEVEGQQAIMKTDMTMTGTVNTTMKRID